MAHHLLVPDLGAAAPRGWGVTRSGGSSPRDGAPRGVKPAPGGPGGARGALARARSDAQGWGAQHRVHRLWSPCGAQHGGLAVADKLPRGVRRWLSSRFPKPRAPPSGSNIEQPCISRQFMSYCAVWTVSIPQGKPQGVGRSPLDIPTHPGAASPRGWGVTTQPRALGGGGGAPPQGHPAPGLPFQSHKDVTL